MRIMRNTPQDIPTTIHISDETDREIKYSEPKLKIVAIINFLFLFNWFSFVLLPFYTKDRSLLLVDSLKRWRKELKKEKKSHAPLCTTGDTLKLGFAQETHLQSPNYKISEMQKDTYDFLTCTSP